MTGRRIVLGGAAAVISLVFGLVASAAVNPPVGSTYDAGWAPNPNIGAATCTSIEAFGGKGDDIFDNTSAFNTAKASTTCLVFPAGIFRFNSAITYGFPTANTSLRIFGQGQDVTVLHFPNAVGNALTITQLNTNNSVHIRGLSMTTDQNKTDTAIFMTTTYTPGSAAGVNNAMSDFNDLAFHGSDGYAQTHQWAKGISTLNVGNINFIGINAFGANGGSGGWATSAQGDGIVIAGNSTKMAPVQFNFVGCNFYMTNNGINIGANIEGVTVSQSNFTGVNNGVYVPASATGYSQLNVTNSQFNALRGINLLSAVPGTNIASNMFIVEGTLTSPIAINIATPAYTTIANNTITQGTVGGGVGINIGANVSGAIGGTITGNTITAKAIGIALTPGAQKFVVANNAFYANTSDVVSDVGANVVDIPLDCTTSAFGIYFGGSNAGITYNARSCSYFQIGKEVTVAAEINLFSKGTATGNATLSGLPVTSTSANEEGAAVVSQYSNFVSTPSLGGYVGQGSGSLAFQVGNGSTGSTQATNANFTNNSLVILRATYRAP